MDAPGEIIPLFSRPYSELWRPCTKVHPGPPRSIENGCISLYTASWGNWLRLYVCPDGVFRVLFNDARARKSYTINYLTLQF